MVSRTQVAAEVAERLHERRAKTVREAAAWLVATGRARQARYLARDVAGVLAEKGYVFVRVTTARKLNETGRRELVRFIKDATGAKEVELELAVVRGVIGGVQVETPAATLDATVKTKLTKYVEGVMG